MRDCTGNQGHEYNLERLFMANISVASSAVLPADDWTTDPKM